MAPVEALELKPKREPIELTQEVLEKLWADCAESQRGDEKCHAAMRGRKLLLKDQNNFDIILSNLYQEEELAPYKTRILTALREASGHEFLQWRAIVAKQQTERVAYQPREKYEAMLKANPAMADMRKLFPDIDY